MFDWTPPRPRTGEAASTELPRARRPFRARRRGLFRGVLAGGALAVVGARPLAVRAFGAPWPTSARNPLRRPDSQLREYWIQADAFLHDLVPNGRDGLMDRTFSAGETTYGAIGFRAYSADWLEPLPGSDDLGPNTGIPGPIIRAVAGDTIRVHFRNNDTHYRFPHSIHPHGLVYTPGHDGAWTARDPDKPGTAIAVGESYTYEWRVVASSVGTWLYHDHSLPQSLTEDAPMTELGAELGLFGMIVVVDDKTIPANREICLFMHDLYKDDVPGLAQDFDCFNGQAFLENTPNLRAVPGERVRWRIAALGKEFHAFHLHGHRWLFNGRYDDTLVLGPATTVTFDFVEDSPGEWLYHCHVTDHMMGGMAGLYTVSIAAE